MGTMTSLTLVSDKAIGPTGSALAQVLGVNFFEHRAALEVVATSWVGDPNR